MSNEVGLLQRLASGLKARVRRRGGRPSGAERHSLVGPGELWQEKRQFQIDFLKSHGLQPQHRFLDVGCGTLRGGIPVIAYLEPAHYVGLEVREHVLDEAWKELAEHHLTDKQPSLLLSHDFATLQCDMQFDFAWAFSVLIHMSDEIAANCLGFVSRHLDAGGVFFANVHIGERRDAAGGRGFPVVTRPLDFYQQLSADAGLALADLGTLESLGHRMGRTGDHHHMLRLTRP